MSKHLDLADLAAGHPEAEKELENYRKIVGAAVAVVQYPYYRIGEREWFALNIALKEAGEI